MRYALKVKASNQPADNYSIMTFQTAAAIDTPEVQAKVSARLVTYFQALRDFNLVQRAEILEVSAKTGTGSVVIPFDVDEYNSAVSAWNDTPTVESVFVGATLLAVINPFEPRGNGSSCMPIGTSVMVSEKAGALRGRCFIASPDSISLNVQNGRLLDAFKEYFRVAHAWVVGVLPDSGVSEQLGVYSATQDVFEVITDVTVKTEYSNLASRRR